MSVGHGMIWPLAAEYARRGWAVRRAGWSNIVTNPFSKSSSLRWIVHHHGLFHLTYLDRGDDFIVGNVSRVARSTDFGVDEFYASDWTVHAPDSMCQVYAESYQQGKLRYPGGADVLPVDDPVVPGTGTGGCPDVPPIGGPGGPGNPGGCVGSCPPPPNCGTNMKVVRAGVDGCGCPAYSCQPLFCPDPPICPPGQRLRVDGYNDLGCAIFRCETSQCPDPPECGDDEKLVVTGYSSNGCADYSCQPLFCPDPPPCLTGQSLTQTGVDAQGCATWTCTGGGTVCGDPPDCGENAKLAIVGRDANGCSIYKCVPTICPDPPTCPTGQSLSQAGEDANGCPIYRCGGGGGGGGTVTAAPITITGVTGNPECFLDNTAPPFQSTIGFTVTLGAAPSPAADGMYWVSVYVKGRKITNINPPQNPGDSVSYSVPVTANMGDNIVISANAYLPIRRVQSNDTENYEFPDWCDTCGDECPDPNTCYKSFATIPANRYYGSHGSQNWADETTPISTQASITATVCFPRKGVYGVWLRLGANKYSSAGSASVTNAKLKLNGNTVATFANHSAPDGTGGSNVIRSAEFTVPAAGTYPVVFEADLYSEVNCRAQIEVKDGATPQNPLYFAYIRKS